MSHKIFSLFEVTSMDVAWKESTLGGLRPPQYSEGGGAPGRDLLGVSSVSSLGVGDQRRTSSAALTVGDRGVGRHLTRTCHHLRLLRYFLLTKT